MREACLGGKAWPESGGRLISTLSGSTSPRRRGGGPCSLGCKMCFGPTLPIGQFRFVSLQCVSEEKEVEAFASKQEVSSSLARGSQQSSTGSDQDVRSHEALKREHKAGLQPESLGLLLKTQLTIWKRRGYPSRELCLVRMPLSVKV